MDDRDTAQGSKVTAQDRADEAQAHADRAQERAERAEARAERAEGRAQEHSAQNRRTSPRASDASGQMEQQMLGEMLVQAELEEAAEKQALKERALRDERLQARSESSAADQPPEEYSGQSGLTRVERNWSRTQPPPRAQEIASRAKHADMAASKAAVTASKAYTAHRKLSRLVEQGRFTKPYAKLEPEDGDGAEE